MADNDIGYCRFCGQAVCDTNDDESATLLCECPQAKTYKRQNDTYNKTVEQIHDVLIDSAKIAGFHQVTDDEIVSFAEHAARLIVYDKLRKVTFSIVGDSAVSLHATSKDTVTVERSARNVYKSEG
jgi:hypothetical protein